MHYLSHGALLAALAAAMAGSPLPGAAEVQDDAAPVDAEFLEFLAEIDAADDETFELAVHHALRDLAQHNDEAVEPTVNSDEKP